MLSRGWSDQTKASVESLVLVSVYSKTNRSLASAWIVRVKTKGEIGSRNAE